jgi:integrase
MGRIIRRGTKAKPRFYLKYRDVDGVDRTKAAKGAYTPKQAELMLAEIERRIMNGKVGIIEPTKEEREKRTITVKELGEKFLAEYSSPKIKDIEQYRKEAKSKLKVRVYPRIGDRPAASLRPVDLERFRDELLRSEEEGGAGLSPSSVTLTLAVLSKMYTWGVKMGYVDCASPVRGCERPPSEHSIDYLSLEEVRNLLAHLIDTVLYPLVAAGVYLGLRKGELFGLRWIDVHLDAARVDVMKSYTGAPKSGKARHVPINRELVVILRAWKEHCPKTDEGLVFPVVEDGVARMGNEYDMLGLPEALKAAGCHIPDKPWHALRHTFASHFMMAGGNILTLQKLLGHSTLAMTMRYAHLSPDHLAAEVQRMTFAPAIPAGITAIGAAG